MSTVRIPIQVATDKSMEIQLRSDGSLTQEATKDLIAPVLADNPELVAAAAAVALEGEGLVFTDDERLPEASSPTIFSLEDSDENYSLDARQDGTVHTADLHTRALTVGGLVYEESDEVRGFALEDPDGNVGFEHDLSGVTFIADGVVRRLRDEDGNVFTPTRGFKRCVLNIIFGQSNGEGRGLPLLPFVDFTRYRHLMATWSGTTVSGLAKATVPLSSQQQQVGFTFASRVAELDMIHSDEETLVVTLNAAAGNSGVIADAPGGNWRVDYAGSGPKLYATLLASITATLGHIQALHGLTPEVWLYWNQGEADSASDPAAYSTAVQAIFSGVRSHLGKASTPIVASGMVPEYRTTGGQALVNALTRLEETVLHYSFVDGVPNGGGSQSISDTVHYTRQGQEILGDQVHAARPRAFVSKVGTTPQKAVNVTAVRVGGSVRVSWTAPYCRVTAYSIEYRVAGGAWTAVSRTVPTALTETFAAAAGLVEVRIATVNDVGTSAFTIPAPAIGA